MTQATSLLKSVDFDFIVNLVITQKLLAYTSGITTSLQTRGIDLAKAADQVQLVIRTLESVRGQAEGFHHTCFLEASAMARRNSVDIKMPRVCKRQTNRANALVSDATLSEEEKVESYYRVNVTIPLLDEIVGSLKSRFDTGQEVVLKGTRLLPSYVVSQSDWESTIQPFIQFYSDELPSIHTINAELSMWKQLWEERWKEEWKNLTEQHFQATGTQMRLSDAELTKLKFGAVPSTVVSALAEVEQSIFPNIAHLLTLLAVVPVTSCEAERSISALRRLKTYMRSSMSQERLTGLALMHVHVDIPLCVEEVIARFAVKHHRRLKLKNILDECDSS